MREADVYHVADRPDGVHWDGIEYYSTAAAARRAVRVPRFVARSTHAPIPPARPEAWQPLPVSFQDQGTPANRVLAGRLLMQEGVEVDLSLPLSSELIFLEEVR
jgi:hypothetical protein